MNTQKQTSNDKAVSVVGGGAWGTTLASIVAEKGILTTLWVRETQLEKNINEKHENDLFLKGIRLPENLKATTDLEAACGSYFIITAVPSQHLRTVARQMSAYVKDGTIIVNVSKGLENGTYARMTQILATEIPKARLIALSGPNHAEEVSMRIPTATVIASKDRTALEEASRILSTSKFKIYPHNDVIGVEICGAVKNITAIATGVCDGLGLGDNAKGSIITLGLSEINNFGRHFGARKATCYGLAGVGDLVATCTSKHSRNRYVGERLAAGLNFEEISKEMKGMVAEGVWTTKSVYEYAFKNNIKMPLTSQAYKVLFENKKIKDAISDLIKLI